MHGGVKFYRRAARVARAYVERDRSRADDYYLGEGSSVATRLTATPDGVVVTGPMSGDTYEPGGRDGHRDRPTKGPDRHQGAAVR